MLFNDLWCKETAVVRLIKHIALSALDTYSSKEIKDIRFFGRREVLEIDKSSSLLCLFSTASCAIVNENQRFGFCNFSESFL